MLTVIAAMGPELAGVRNGLKSRGPSPVETQTIGIGRERVQASLDRLLDSQSQPGEHGLLLLGFAGGLDPALKPGDLLVPTCYYHESGDLIATDGDMWQQARVAAAQSGLCVVQGNTLTVERLVATPEDKREMYRRHQVSSVNMEDYWVAEAAARARVPFLAVRAVLDPVSQALPCYVMGLAGGRADAVVKAAIHPWRLPALLRLARMKRAAQASLTRFALGFINYQLAAGRQPPISG